MTVILVIGTDPKWARIFISSGISSFTRKMEKIYGVEKDEGKLVRLLLATTKSGGKIKILQAFINCLSAFFKEITSACETEKDLLKREIKLEKKFTEMHCSGIHYVNVSKVWHQVCSAQAAYNASVRNGILQLILQHVWVSGFKLNKIHSGEMSTTFNTCVTDLNENETETILDHAGWAIKRTRDVIKKGTESIQLKQNNDPHSALVNAEKTTALTIISELGEDVAQHDGMHRFKVHEKASDFFTYLHTQVEGHLHENIVFERGDVLLKCLDGLSLDSDLRTKWMNLIGPNWDIKASIVVLQRIVRLQRSLNNKSSKKKKG